MITRRDVLFKEEEEWDGKDDSEVTTRALILDVEEELEEEVGQPNQTWPKNPQNIILQSQSSSESIPNISNK